MVLHNLSQISCWTSLSAVGCSQYSLLYLYSLQIRVFPHFGEVFYIPLVKVSFILTIGKICRGRLKYIYCENEIHPTNGVKRFHV